MAGFVSGEDLYTCRWKYHLNTCILTPFLTALRTPTQVGKPTAHKGRQPFLYRITSTFYDKIGQITTLTWYLLSRISCVSKVVSTGRAVMNTKRLAAPIFGRRSVRYASPVAEEPQESVSSYNRVQPGGILKIRTSGCYTRPDHLDRSPRHYTSYSSSNPSILSTDTSSPPVNLHLDGRLCSFYHRGALCHLPPRAYRAPRGAQLEATGPGIRVGFIST